MWVFCLYFIPYMFMQHTFSCLFHCMHDCIAAICYAGSYHERNYNGWWCRTFCPWFVLHCNWENCMYHWYLNSWFLIHVIIFSTHTEACLNLHGIHVIISDVRYSWSTYWFASWCWGFILSFTFAWSLR